MGGNGAKGKGKGKGKGPKYGGETIIDPRIVLTDPDLLNYGLSSTATTFLRENSEYATLNNKSIASSIMLSLSTSNPTLLACVKGAKELYKQKDFYGGLIIGAAITSTIFKRIGGPLADCVQIFLSNPHIWSKVEISASGLSYRWVPQHSDHSNVLGVIGDAVRLFRAAKKHANGAPVQPHLGDKVFNGSLNLEKEKRAFFEGTKIHLSMQDMEQSRMAHIETNIENRNAHFEKRKKEKSDADAAAAAEKKRLEDEERATAVALADALAQQDGETSDMIIDNAGGFGGGGGAGAEHFTLSPTNITTKRGSRAHRDRSRSPRARLSRSKYSDDDNENDKSRLSKKEERRKAKNAKKIKEAEITALLHGAGSSSSGSKRVG
jgi:hypothetical protein